MPKEVLPNPELEREVHRVWPVLRSGPPYLLQRAFSCVTRLFERARAMPRAADMPLELHVENALLTLCQEDSEFLGLYIHSRIQKRAVRIIMEETRLAADAIRALADELPTEVYLRLKGGQRVLDGFLRSNEPEGRFPKYANTSIRNVFIELLRTRRHGDHAWKNAESLSEPQSLQRHEEAIAEVVQACASAHDTLIRDNRKLEFEKILECLQQRIAQEPDPRRREALTAWLENLSSGNEKTQKEIAENSQIPETTLKNWIHRLKEELGKEHFNTLARIFAATRSDAKEIPA